MARAKRRDMWDQTASLRSDIRNMFRGEGVPAIHPDELNPLREYRRPAPQRDPHIVKSLVASFVGL